MFTKYDLVELNNQDFSRYFKNSFFRIKTTEEESFYFVEFLGCKKDNLFYIKDNKDICSIPLEKVEIIFSFPESGYVFHKSSPVFFRRKAIKQFKQGIHPDSCKFLHPYVFLKHELQILDIANFKYYDSDYYFKKINQIKFNFDGLNFDKNFNFFFSNKAQNKFHLINQNFVVFSGLTLDNSLFLFYKDLLVSQVFPDKKIQMISELFLQEVSDFFLPKQFTIV